MDAGSSLPAECESVVRPPPSMGESRAARLVLSQKAKSLETPVIVDENLLLQAVDDPELLESGGAKPAHLAQVKSMTFSFRSLLEIQGLGNLRGLRRLRLDNNLIERISGLESLVNLKWLDLSFNLITRIEGLGGQLKSLTDLSLYHNQIADLASMEHLRNLSIFSIGRNKLKDLKQLEYLRVFQQLRCVCLEGNPMTENENFHAHVYTYLPQLQYLDYQVIDQKTAQSLSETYHAEEISELRERELAAAQHERTQKDRQTLHSELKKQFLDATFDLTDELFLVQPFQVLVLQGYGVLKDEFIENVEYTIKMIKTQVSDKTN